MMNFNIIIIIIIFNFLLFNKKFDFLSQFNRISKISVKCKGKIVFIFKNPSFTFKKKKRKRKWRMNFQSSQTQRNFLQLN